MNKITEKEFLLLGYCYFKFEGENIEEKGKRATQEYLEYFDQSFKLFTVIFLPALNSFHLFAHT